MYRLFKSLKAWVVRILFAAMLAIVLAVPEPLMAQFSGCASGSCPTGNCSSGWVTIDETVVQPANRSARRRDTGGVPESVTPPSSADYVSPEPVNGAGNDIDLPVPPVPEPDNSSVPSRGVAGVVPSAQNAQNAPAATTDTETKSKLAELDAKLKELKTALSNVPQADEIKAVVTEQAAKTDQLKGEITSDITEALKDIPSADALVSKVGAKFAEISAAVDAVKSAQYDLAAKVEEAKAAAEAPESNARLKLAAVILQILFCSGILMAALGWLIAAVSRFLGRVWKTYKAGRTIAIGAAASVKDKIADGIEFVSEQVKAAANQNTAQDAQKASAPENGPVDTTAKQ